MTLMQRLVVSSNEQTPRSYDEFRFILGNIKIIMDMCISMANKLVEMDWSQEFNAKDPQLLFDMYHKVTFTMQVMPVSLNELYVAWQSKTWIVTMEEEHNITEDLKKLMFVHKQFNETILIHKLDQIGSQISNLIKLFCEDQEVC